MCVFKDSDEIGGIAQITAVKAAKNYSDQARISLLSKLATGLVSQLPVFFRRRHPAGGADIGTPQFLRRRIAISAHQVRR